MKKLLNIILLFAIALNSFGQSKIKKDIVEAEQQLIIDDVDFVDWITDSTGAVSIDGSNGLSKNGTDIEWGNSTLDTTTTIAGGGNILNLGTAASKLSLLNVNASGNISVVSDALIGLSTEGKVWVLSGDYIINVNNGDTLCTLAVLEAAIAAAQPVLPFNYDYTFSTSIVDSRPGIGLFKFNNATLTNVTEIYIDYFDANSVAKNDWFAEVDTGSVITVQTDVNNYVIYQLTDALIDAGNYYKYNVTYSSHNGVISGLNTIDIELNNTTGSGGGTAISEHGNFDTISSWNTSFVYFDSTVVIEDTLKIGDNLMRNRGDGINIEDASGDSYVYLNSSDATLGYKSNNYISIFDSYVYLSNNNGSNNAIAFIGDTLFMDGTGGSTENVIKTSAISVGGAEVVDTSYGSQYTIENTFTDKFNTDTLLMINDTISGQDLLLTVRKILYPNDYVSYLPNDSIYTTPLVTLNTPTKVLIPTALKYTRNWAFFDKGGSDFALQFQGADSSRFNITSTTSLSTSASNVVFEIFMYKNGILEPGIASERKIGTGSDVGSISLSGAFDMDANDYIEIFVLVDISSTITFIKTSIVIKEDGSID